MEYAITDRTTLRRLAARGSHDRELVHAIIDEALICHVGFAVDGRPWVVPTIHTRIDDTLYFHGALANHMLRSMADGLEVCVTMTLIDGLVMARSAFHHSMNYRSAMVFGRATKVEGAEKDAAFHALVEHVAPGRMTDARPPSPAEARTTLVLALPITEASAKVRTGGPVDDDEDMDSPIWAGVVPARVAFGTPAADNGVTAPVPEYLARYTR